MKQQNKEDNIAKEEELHSEEDDDLMADIKGLPEEVQAQVLSGLLMKLVPLGISLLSNMCRRG